VIYPQASEYESYTGQIQNGQRHGYGVLKWKNGRSYSGKFQNDEREGLGKLVDQSGNYYEGSFKNDTPTGLGMWKQTDGTVYTGYFYKGIKDGFGVQTWPDGQRYDGEWKWGEKDGYGTYFYSKNDSSNATKYSGSFRDDQFSGQGTLSWKDGSVYTGNFKFNYRNGFGLMIWPDGSTYKGQWENGFIGTLGGVLSVSEVIYKESGEYNKKLWKRLGLGHLITISPSRFCRNVEYIPESSDRKISTCIRFIVEEIETGYDTVRVEKS
jgi:hypothetical protein